MENDDQQVGRVLSRREVLALFGAAGAVVLVGCGSSASPATQATSVASQAAARGSSAASLNAEAATAVATATANPGLSTTAEAMATTGNLPACVVSPELTEGPYFVDTQLNRSDIRVEPSDGSVKEGMPIALAVRVSQISGGQCTPLSGALVDLWQCDAKGVYSGVTDNSQGFNTVEQKFLRGYQQTDADGIARFTTIYPGSYPGRAVHIHFKVRADAGSGQTHEFTSQMFFDDALSDKVYTQEPYAGNGARNTTNARDGIYRNGGEQLLLALSETNEGYAGTFDIGLNLSDTTGRG